MNSSPAWTADLHQLLNHDPSFWLFPITAPIFYARDQQAKEYQNTTAKVGILLVLNLLPKPNGIGSFESNIKLEITSTVADPEPRGIVVIKIPGNRLTPSAVVL